MSGIFGRIEATHAFNNHTPIFIFYFWEHRNGVLLWVFGFGKIDKTNPRSPVEGLDPRIGRGEGREHFHIYFRIGLKG
jgi:hypothetical protein